MPKTVVDPSPDVDVMNNSSDSNSMIYIIVLLCIIVIGSFFMFKVYKRLQKLNDEVINITTKGDSLDSNSKEHNRKLDILAENLRRVENNAVKTAAVNNIGKLDPPKHVEISLDNNETKVLEDITEE
tara:strand:+ start:25030 stop:25410 length:381 start_codon:yes stop_codon:yes gene_type:complete